MNFHYAAITVSFDQSTYSVNETAGPVQPVLVLSNPSVRAITVVVLTANGTATGKILKLLRHIIQCVPITGGGDDFDSGPYTVTFSTRQISALLNVPINDDNVLENNEEFTMTIDSSSLPNGVSPGSNGAATVTIMDDDGNSLCISSQ